MSAELVRAIDAVVVYVRTHSAQMTLAEVDELDSLAERVYLLGFREGIDRALPRVPELQPELESCDPPLPRVQFVSKLNLPGDWDTSSLESPDAAALQHSRG